MSEKIFQWKLNRIKKLGERYKREKELRDAYAEYVPDKKKRKVSNVMLVSIVAAIVIYTSAALFVQYRTGVPIDATLSTLYFSFWTVELVALTTIKNYKTKYEKSIEDESHG